MTADRFDVFLCPAASADVEKALRADGLRVFRSSPFDDFDKIAPELAGSRVVLADHSVLSDRVLALVPGEPLPDLVRRVRRAAVPGSSLLWTVHSALVARGSVLVHGLPGAGKTALAEQYAGLAGEFGGRVLRTGPFGHLDPDEFLPQFHLALAAAAGTAMGGFDRLRARLAARMDAAGSRVLVLVDDVPAGVPPGELARVLVPSGAVRTLLTSRAAHWDGATVEVPGLTVAEGLRLVPSPEFVARCFGHPMTLRAAAVLRSRGDSVPDTAPDAIREVLLRMERPAREVLRLGSVLAPSPIPVEVVVSAVGGEVEAAVEELVSLGFAARADGGLRLQGLAVEVARGVFGEPAADGAVAAVLNGLAGGVADGLADGLPGDLAHRPTGEPATKSAHGLPSEPAHGPTGEPASRLAHGLPSESAHGPTGDPATKSAHGLPSEPAHGPTGDPATKLAHGLPSESAHGPTGEPATKLAHGLPSDLAHGATGEPAHGSGTELAHEPARRAPRESAHELAGVPTITHSYLIQHARTLADHSPAHRLALLRPVAATFEALGDPATAGEIHATILATGEATPADFTAAARVELACGLVPEALDHARRAAGHQPAARVLAQALDSRGDYAEADRLFWLAHRPVTAEDRLHAAKARRLRGRPEEAIALLEPGEPTLEYARNLLQAGHAQQAQDVAATLDSPDADVIRAEAALVDHDPADLEKAYAQRFGIESPLTLTASVHAARAREPRHALAALTRAGPVVRRVLGDDHPLHLRLRYAAGLAHARLREFDRQADLLCGIAGPQLRLLGRTHPDTVETRLDLGVALALSSRGPLDRAIRLVDAAARDAGPGLAAQARVAQQVVRLVRP
ncbi:hypothetical protein [Amycolatopsis sp. NPDC098790]|uniref:hypothetical protein n=1 Tax=Amycolatopsis sp. NPDC098790 TaxID=3363939 RepID=UPI003822EC2B